MRFSKQREAVYRTLYHTDIHPDAAWIYAKTRETEPNIGIATVYRNLNELVSSGRIKRISVEGYAERFDADMREHGHMVCERCGRITDVDCGSVSVACSVEGVTRCEITFYAFCDSCRKKNKSGEYTNEKMDLQSMRLRSRRRRGSGNLSSLRSRQRRVRIGRRIIYITFAVGK